MGTLHKATGVGAQRRGIQGVLTRGLPIIPACSIYITICPQTPLNLLLAYFLAPNICRVQEINSLKVAEIKLSWVSLLTRAGPIAIEGGLGDDNTTRLCLRKGA